MWCVRTGEDRIIHMQIGKPQIKREPGAVLYPGSTKEAPGVLNFPYSITWLGACLLVKKGQGAPGPCFLKSMFTNWWHDLGPLSHYSQASENNIFTEIGDVKNFLIPPRIVYI